MTPGEPDRPGERVLVLAPTGRDASLTCAMLAQAGLSAASCAGVEELCQALESRAGAALVAEEVLAPPVLARLTEALARQPPWSNLPLVVFSGGGPMAQAGARTAAVLEALRNVTFLERPLRTLTLVSVVRAALDARRRQYEVRDLLHELAKGLRQRDEFLAMLGHELRNPLGAIANAVEVLDRITSPEAGPARQRQVIRHQTRHLVRLVEDLLDVARVSSGKIVLQRLPVDLTEVARRSLEMLDGAVRDAGHDLSFRAGPAPVLVEGDPVRLEQVVTNLVANAIKYTCPPGRIEVFVRAEGGEGVLEVRDNGLGLAPEMVASVFELFTQVRASLDRSHGGLGIGLTLVRRLVDLHGGSVQATSPGLGQGSAFVVRLPLRSLPHSSLPEASPSAPEQNHRFSPCHILLIEDDASNRETLRALLELDGHRVEVAEDGLKGVEKALALGPNFALVDLGLPVLDGYEVARRLRADPRGAGIRLIALTGYGQAEDRRRSAEVGFDEHLVKPLDVEHLQRLLASSPAGGSGHECTSR